MSIMLGAYTPDDLTDRVNIFDADDLGKSILIEKLNYDNSWPPHYYPYYEGAVILENGSIFKFRTNSTSTMHDDHNTHVLNNLTEKTGKLSEAELAVIQEYLNAIPETSKLEYSPGIHTYGYNGGTGWEVLPAGGNDPGTDEVIEIIDCYISISTQEPVIDVISVSHNIAQKGVNTVYFFLEYKIDLANKEFWMYSGGTSDNYVLRDKTAENSGFVFVKDLSDEAIAAFLLEAAKCGFDAWSQQRYGEFSDGGYSWYFNIQLSESSLRERRYCSSSKSNVYPETWDDMAVAFKILTGEDILAKYTDE